MYKNIDIDESIEGIKERYNPKNQFKVLYIHYTADPNKATSEWFKKTKKGTPLAAWNKEYEIDFYALSGQRIWPEYDPRVHIIPAFGIPKEWSLVRGIDFGQWNATCCLWGAVDFFGNLYLYREYYKAGRITASAHAAAIAEMSIDKEGNPEEYVGSYIDPSTRARNQSRRTDAGTEVPYSVFEIFDDNGVSCTPANNDLRTGWDRVSDYMKLREVKDEHENILELKPKMFFMQGRTPVLCQQIPKYRYAIQTPQMAAKQDPDEKKQVKKEDHAPDALRYLTVEQSPLPEKEEKPLTRIQKDIQAAANKHKTMEVKAWTEFNTN